MLNEFERNYIIQKAYKEAGINVEGLVKAHNSASSFRRTVNPRTPDKLKNVLNLGSGTHEEYIQHHLYNYSKNKAYSDARALGIKPQNIGTNMTNR